MHWPGNVCSCLKLGMPLVDSVMSLLHTGRARPLSLGYVRSCRITPTPLWRVGWCHKCTQRRPRSSPGLAIRCLSMQNILSFPTGRRRKGEGSEPPRARSSLPRKHRARTAACGEKAGAGQRNIPKWYAPSLKPSRENERSPR